PTITAAPSKLKPSALARFFEAAEAGASKGAGSAGGVAAGATVVSSPDDADGAAGACITIVSSVEGAAGCVVSGCGSAVASVPEIHRVVACLPPMTLNSPGAKR